MEIHGFVMDLSREVQETSKMTELLLPRFLRLVRFYSRFRSCSYTSYSSQNQTSTQRPTEFLRDFHYQRNYYQLSKPKFPKNTHTGSRERNARKVTPSHRFFVIDGRKWLRWVSLRPQEALHDRTFFVRREEWETGVSEAGLNRDRVCFPAVKKC